MYIYNCTSLLYVYILCDFSIPPSQSCGPFRLYESKNATMFDTISNTVSSWPNIARDIFYFLGTVGFFVPVIIILWLVLLWCTYKNCAIIPYILSICYNNPINFYLKLPLPSLPFPSKVSSTADKQL